MLKAIVLVMCYGMTMPSFAVLRDPTEPPMGIDLELKVKPELELLVSSIIISPTRRLALINGRYVKPGDMVAGNKVVSIRRDYVLLSQSGKKYKIYVIKNGVQKKRR